MTWQPHGPDQKRCTDHDVVFARTTTCPSCSPGVRAAVEIAPVTTDKELDLLESELRAEARYYRKLGRELTGDGADGAKSDINSGLKAAEVALKYDRAYKEILAERKGREHDQWLVEQNRLLQGNGASH